MSFDKLVNYFYDKPWAAILAILTIACGELFRRLMNSQKEHMEDLRVIAPLADKLTDMLQIAARGAKKRKETPNLPEGS